MIAIGNSYATKSIDNLLRKKQYKLVLKEIYPTRKELKTAKAVTKVLNYKFSNNIYLAHFNGKDTYITKIKCI